MEPVTMTRAQLLELFQQQGGPDTVALVEQLFGRLRWETKDSFVEADMITIMEGINQLAREALSTPQARALVKPDERAHANALLNAMDQHAFPILRDAKKS